MKVSPGWMTFLIGLVILALAGVIYQQSLARAGAYGTGSTAIVTDPNVKYACPMRCVELDEPGDCPVCGMEMTPIVKSGTETVATEQGSDGPQMFVCPMHPQVVQDHEGTCPICGMELVPQRSDEAAVDAATAEAVSAVKLSPLQAVLADVQAVHPTREKMAVTVTAIGEVAVAQGQTNVIVSWQEGRVDDLVVREAGGSIAKGEHILDIYSEELVQAQEEYLVSLDAVERLADSGYESVTSSTEGLLEASRLKLGRLGMTADQIAALSSERRTTEDVPIYATHGGVILEKHVTEGMYVMRGEELFTVAALDPIWVELTVFESDAAMLRAGDRVSLTTPLAPGKTFSGRVELIEPEFDMETRTLRARVVVDNPAGTLRPGMIVDAKLAVSYGELLLLPRNAVLHTGDGDLVYVLVGEQLWAPREVEVGRDFGDKLEIVGGLSRDEAVAATSVFMLDSEAQLKGVPRPVDLPAVDAPAPDPHAGH